MITSPRLAIVVALFAFASSVWAGDSAVPPELCGILATGKTHRFALISQGGERSGWSSLGDTFEGWKIEEYRAATDAVVLSRDTLRVTISLRAGTVTDGQLASETKATITEADAMLGKMQFEAMWDRIVDEQKKGIVGAIRQQSTAEFAKAGLRPDEIDGLLDKMGNTLVSGMQSDAMRQDFARIYSEVYTKDELSGMAAFYETTAGQAWNRKQPEVQQKLMQVLMPRVMQGMPAAQKLATDYIRQRNATPSPSK